MPVMGAGKTEKERGWSERREEKDNVCLCVHVEWDGGCFSSVTSLHWFYFLSVFFLCLKRYLLAVKMGVVPVVKVFPCEICSQSLNNNKIFMVSYLSMESHLHITPY